jgi:hypothetical protein
MTYYYKIALACLTTLLITAPAVAKEATTNCGANSSQVKPAEMHDCLARMNDPARVRERQEQARRDSCEQNAKNRKLDGSAKASFMSSCMNENQAAAAHASATQGRPAPSAQPRPTVAASKKKAANSCLKQANSKGLKGKERKDFLKTCKPV